MIPITSDNRLPLTRTMQNTGLTPTTILNGKYRLLSQLGAGGMGVVYKAEQLSLKRNVAIKVLSTPEDMTSEDSQSFQKMFFREASLCAKLSHPNIVTIHDYGKVESPRTIKGFFIAMELIQGETLDDFIAKHPKGASGQDAVRLMGEVLKGLREAHKMNVVHRDLKPANIMLVGGEETRVKILDFGLVHPVGGDDSLIGNNQVVGTPHYMSPEQIQMKPLDRRSDLYSLGVILFELIAGTVPFNDKNIVNVALDHVAKPVPPIASVNPNCKISKSLESILYRLLEKDPEKRFGSVDELIGAMKSIPEATTADVSGATTRVNLVLEAHGKYILEQKLSQGTHSTSYEAIHSELGRKVFVKLYAPRNQAESSAIARDLPGLSMLRHPFNARLLDIGSANIGGMQWPFAVFEHIRGDSLRVLLNRKFRLSASRAVKITTDICQALSEAHAVGIVHRKLTPERVLLMFPEKNQECVRLTGYSFASANSGSGELRSMQDARSYIPPEVLTQGARLNETTDVFSVGSMFFEMLSGTKLFSENDNRHYGQTDIGRIPNLSAVPQAFIRVLHQAIHTNPRDRFHSAKEFLDALIAAQQTLEPPPANHSRGVAQTWPDSEVLWSLQRREIWIFREDPVFNTPEVRELLDSLRAEYTITEVDENQQSLEERLQAQTILPPWVVLFGDLSVILENQLLSRLGESAEVSKMLISTHGNAELLQTSINFVGLDRQECLPTTAEQLRSSVELMVEKAQKRRMTYDLLRSSISLKPSKA